MTITVCVCNIDALLTGPFPRTISLLLSFIIGERAKRARHSQICSIENRGYIYIYIYI